MEAPVGWREGRGIQPPLEVLYAPPVVLF